MTDMSRYNAAALREHQKLYHGRTYDIDGNLVTIPAGAKRRYIPGGYVIRVRRISDGLEWEATTGSLVEVTS